MKDSRNTFLYPSLHVVARGPSAGTSQFPGPTGWLPLSWAFLENLCSLWGW